MVAALVTALENKIRVLRNESPADAADTAVLLLQQLTGGDAPDRFGLDPGRLRDLQNEVHLFATGQQAAPVEAAVELPTRRGREADGDRPSEPEPKRAVPAPRTRERDGDAGRQDPPARRRLFVDDGETDVDSSDSEARPVAPPFPPPRPVAPIEANRVRRASERPAPPSHIRSKINLRRRGARGAPGPQGERSERGERGERGAVGPQSKSAWT